MSASAAAILNLALSLTGRWLKFQFTDHKLEQLLPTLKHPVTRQRAAIVKEGMSGGEGAAELLILGVPQVEEGVTQKR